MLMVRVVFHEEQNEVVPLGGGKHRGMFFSPFLKGDLSISPGLEVQLFSASVVFFTFIFSPCLSIMVT